MILNKTLNKYDNLLLAHTFIETIRIKGKLLQEDFYSGTYIIFRPDKISISEQFPHPIIFVGVQKELEWTTRKATKRGEWIFRPFLI